MQHPAATDRAAALALLHEAVAAVVADTPHGLLKGIVLSCLADAAVSDQPAAAAAGRQGTFRVSSVLLTRLGTAVRAACTAAGAAAWSVYEGAYRSKLSQVLRDLPEFVSVQQLGQGTQCALLRADVLLARLARQDAAAAAAANGAQAGLDSAEGSVSRAGSEGSSSDDDDDLPPPGRREAATDSEAGSEGSDWEQGESGLAAAQRSAASSGEQLGEFSIVRAAALPVVSCAFAAPRPAGGSAPLAQAKQILPAMPCRP